MADTPCPFTESPGGAVTVRPGASLRGTARVPGDKSLSHRALILAALADGKTAIEGLNDGDDVARTRLALEAFGAQIETAEMRDTSAPDAGAGAAGGPGAMHAPEVVRAAVARPSDVTRVRGVAGRLREPGGVIDVGNSGTSLRLLAGLAASVEGLTVFTGDASLRRRPVDRVAEPLTWMGATCLARGGGRLPPLVVRGGVLRGITYDLPLPSAQVKSAILLAALAARGTTSVGEPLRSRDHTERMLGAFGSPPDSIGGRIALSGPRVLTPPAGGRLRVPGDPSAAAFLVVAALLAPSSEIVVEDVCVNPTRTGWIDVLRAMGGEVEALGERTDPEAGGEPVAALRVRTSALRGVDIDPALVPRLLDEVPILAVAAAHARGVTTLRGAADLRAKESDRLAVTARGLRAVGVTVEELPDGLVIEGRAGRPCAGATIAAAGDHRVAMAFAVAGLVAAAPITIDDARPIATSFPEFFATLSGLVR